MCDVRRGHCESESAQFTEEAFDECLLSGEALANLQFLFKSLQTYSNIRTV